MQTHIVKCEIKEMASVTFVFFFYENRIPKTLFIFLHAINDKKKLHLLIIFLYSLVFYLYFYFYYWIIKVTFHLFPCIVVVQSLCLTLCNSMNCSTPGFPVIRCLPEFAQTDVHWVSNAIQLSYPLSSLPLLCHSPLLKMKTFNLYFKLLYKFRYWFKIDMKSMDILIYISVNFS